MLLFLRKGVCPKDNPKSALGVARIFFFPAYFPMICRLACYLHFHFQKQTHLPMRTVLYFFKVKMVPRGLLESPENVPHGNQRNT